MKTTNEITSIADLMEKTRILRGATSRHEHVRFWFRGQSDVKWPLQLGVYRRTFPAKNEADRLNTERHLNQDFRIWAAGHLKEEFDDADLYFLQQHYKMPTRLLDWTTNPLAALFFAVSGAPKVDANLFMMDAYQLANDQPVTGFKGILTSRNPIFINAVSPVVNWVGTEDSFPKTIMPVRPKHFDHRVTLQRSCFTYHVPTVSVLTSLQNTTLRVHKIPALAKGPIRSELALLGIDHYSIFGDLENLSTMLKGAYQIE